VVVRVDSRIWKQVVTGFAEVSSLEEGLPWELEYLSKYTQMNIVLVGLYDALERLSAQPLGNREGSGIDQRLIALLNGKRVLDCRNGTSSDTRRFARLLKARLNEQSVIQPISS
jgi:hypothetical protein